MKHFILLATSAAILAFSTPVMASSYKAGCNAGKGEWMSLDAIKTKAVELGYDVRRIKKEDGCYEVYAIDKKGALLELYMNPVTGEIVKTKNKS